MNELKQKLELEDKEYLVASILDMQNMIDHQRRQLIKKEKNVEMYRGSNIIYEDTLNRVRDAILNLMRGIATNKIQGMEAIIFHLEQLTDAI